MTNNAMKRLFLGGLFFLAMGCMVLMLGGCGKKSDTPGGGKTSAAAGDENVITITSEGQFQEVLNQHQVVLADFYAVWCPPCRALKPKIHELAAQYAGVIAVAAVDVDKVGALAEAYGVRSIPDVRIFKQGKEVKSFVGLRDKEDYIKVLTPLIAAVGKKTAKAPALPKKEEPGTTP